MFSIVKLTAAIFGAIVVFETWLITLALGVIVTPISFCLSIVVGVPVYLLSAFSGGEGNSAIATIDRYAWGAHWAVNVTANTGDRFMSILDGRPSGKRGEMLQRIKDFRQSRGRSARLPDDLRNFKNLDDSATVMLIVGLLANIPILIFILIQSIGLLPPATAWRVRC
jgi:hypothetical protein